jgi:hypothetical protein
MGAHCKNANDSPQQEANMSEKMQQLPAKQKQKKNKQENTHRT